MIPGKIVQFLNEHANMGFGGVRDAQMNPAGCRVSAWRVEADGRTLTVLIPGPFIERILEPLTENGQFAMIAEEHPTHVTYQVKGRFLRQRPVNARDLELVQQTRTRLSRSMRFVLPPDFEIERVLRWHAPDPEVAIEVEMGEVFLQTPGPQAGSRIHPAPTA